MAQDSRSPELSFEMLKGSDKLLSELLQEGPVIIDFWALWCAPCLRGMRHLDRLQREYARDGLQVVAVNIDSERSTAKVRGYVKSHKYAFAVAMDHSQKIYRKFNGVTLPFTLLIDSEGSIVYRHIGYLPGDELDLAKAVNKILSR